MKAIQLVQNNLLRTLNGTKVEEKISIAHMLEKFKMLLVNQLNANIKLLEVWKALNVEEYPLKIVTQSIAHENRVTRADTSCRPCEIGKTDLVQKTSVSNSVHLWNRAPGSLKKCTSIYQAKKETRSYARSLPI